MIEELKRDLQKLSNERKQEPGGAGASPRGAIRPEAVEKAQPAAATPGAQRGRFAKRHAAPTAVTITDEELETLNLQRLEPAAVVRGGRVVAFVKVLRNSKTTQPRQADSYDFLTMRNTTLELMRSKALLSRAVRKQEIAELPLMQKQADPVQWLQDNLQLRYPNDAELLEIALQGGDLEQLKQVVNAIVDVYFQEVVEKARTERAKKEAKLKELYDKKTGELENQRQRLQVLEKLTQQLDADLKKIDTERNSPPRIERVPARSAAVSPAVPAKSAMPPATSAVTPVETASPPVEPAHRRPRRHAPRQRRNLKRKVLRLTKPNCGMSWRRILRSSFARCTTWNRCESS